MSRTMDARLTEHIVEKAHHLWSKHGEDAVTLRAVAKAAGTTTPSVYARFATKEDLIDAVAHRVRLEIAHALIGNATLQAGCRAYLDLAAHRHREYQLVYGAAWGKLFRNDQPRPAFEWAVQRLAKQHGGKPEDYHLAAYAVWYLLHGAASMLQHVSSGAAAEELRKQCLAACDAIIKNPLKTTKKRKK